MLNQFFSSPLFLGLVATAFILYVVTLIHINLKLSKKKRRKNQKKAKVSNPKSDSKTVTDFCLNRYHCRDCKHEFLGLNEKSCPKCGSTDIYDTAKGQYLGFLEDKTKLLRKHVTFTIPNNCLHCNFLVKCQNLKSKKGWRKLLSCIVVFAFFMSMFNSSLVLADVKEDLIAETPLTVFGEHEWVHVSVGGNHAGSVAWEGYGEDVQLVFYAYNDNGLSFDQFVIEANISYYDPFNKFYVYWGGKISGEDKILLKFYSFLGQTTTLVEPFAGEAPHYGRPGTRVKKNVITGENEIFDVFGANDIHLCSFEWSFISVSNNITNVTQSIPSLIVYDPDGDKYDTKVLSATMLPLIEYFDMVGFMVDTMGPDYVKWVLYSDQSLRVAINQGFEDQSLPSFSVDPVSLRVEPSERVTVSFVLPEGITEYEGSWESRSVRDYVELLSDEVYADGEHVVEFRFLESAKNKRFTVEVSCEKYGTSYSGSAMVEVVPSAWESIVPGVIVLGFIIVGCFFGLRWLIRQKREDASAQEVTSEVLHQ